MHGIRQDVATGSDDALLTPRRKLSHRVEGPVRGDCEGQTRATASIRAPSRCPRKSQPSVRSDTVQVTMGGASK